MMRPVLRFALPVLCAMPLLAQAQCENKNSAVKAGTMHAQINLVLSGEVRAGQHLGEFTFQRDGGTAPVAECPPGSDVYGYALRPSFQEIDGRPTYAFGFNTGYAYALEERASQKYFTSNGTPIPFEGDLYPPDVRIHIYATQDNPTVTLLPMTNIGGLHIVPGQTNIGFYYTAMAYIKVQASCSVETSNLRIVLPPVSVNDFPQRGYAQSGAYGEDQLSINCTGDMAAEIMLTASHGVESLDGQEAILRIENEGRDNNASGVGFVLSSPDNGERLLLHNQYVPLGDLRSGRQTLPIRARYYRYGSEVRAGLANSSAAFVIKFN